MIFISFGVARQHRIAHADLNIVYSPLFSNIGYNKHNKYGMFVYINDYFGHWSPKCFPYTEPAFSANFMSMSTSGRQIKVF